MTEKLFLFLHSLVLLVPFDDVIGEIQKDRTKMVKQEGYVYQNNYDTYVFFLLRVQIPRRNAALEIE